MLLCKYNLNVGPMLYVDFFENSVMCSKQPHVVFLEAFTIHESDWSKPDS